MSQNVLCELFSHDEQQSNNFYINIYLKKMKSNSNAVGKSFCAVFTGVVTYTMYKKLEIYVHYRREEPADPSAIQILIHLPTSQIS
jgi:hypothetical protein